MPRVGWDVDTQRYMAGLAAGNAASMLAGWAQTAPLRLLEVLVDSNPLAQMALSNDVSFAFAPGSTRYVAVASAADKEVSEEGTAALDYLWSLLDPIIPSYLSEGLAKTGDGEAGGMIALQWTIARWYSVAGLNCIEAIPGGRGRGLIDVLDFSPFSVRFKDTEEGARVLEQRQAGTTGGWEALPPETCFPSAWFGRRDNPYGKPRYAAALNELLADAAEQGKLSAVLDAVAWPHLKVSFDANGTIKFAKENEDVLAGQADDGADLTPLAYALSTFSAFVEKMQAMKADDVLYMLAGSDADIIRGGDGLPALDGTFERRRLRICQSLDQLPNLMGITDGGTQAYSSVQWKAYATKLEALRAFVNAVMVWIANLHLRLLGMPLVARAEVEPIQTSDKMVDASARKVEIENEERLIRMGFRSPADACQSLTGSGVVDEAKSDAYFAAPAAAPAALPTPTDPTDPPNPADPSGGQGAA